MKQSALVATLSLLVIAAAVLPAATVAGTTVKPSKYTYQEDEKRDFVKRVSTFSATIYKLAHMLTMYYVSTSQCWSVRAGAGYEYWVVLTATNGAGASGSYVSRVWGIRGSESRTWKLLSFNSTN